MTVKKSLLILIAVITWCTASLSAQAEPYKFLTMNFDMWCQETQHLPPDRCDKRLQSDEATFEAYRARVEKYELPHAKRREDSHRLNRSILHNDPIDNPITQNLAAASQSATSPTTRRGP